MLQIGVSTKGVLSKMETQSQKPDKTQGKYTTGMNHITDQAVQEFDGQGIWVVTGRHKEDYQLEVCVTVRIELDTGAAISVISEQQ